MAESIKNRTVRKDEFFDALNSLRSENSNSIKVAYISEDYAKKSADFSDVPVNWYEFNGEQQKSVSAQELNFNINFRLEA